jgi:MFS family permease
MGKQSTRRTLPRAAAFWVLAGLFLVLFFASAAASPLYGVHQIRFHFSAATLTAVFAVYVLVLLLTLLFFGLVSDYLGRLPVISVALVFSVAACVVFLTARDVGELYAARALQGISAGLATGPIGAALRAVGSRAALLAGCLLLIAGMALTFFAVATTTSAAFYAGTVVAGTGFGLVSLGSFTMIPARAEPWQRAGLVTAIYIAGYLAFSIPALIAGITTTRSGLHPTALVYTVAVAVLAATAGGILLLRPDDQQEGSRREPPGPAASIPADTAEAARTLGSAGGAVRHGFREPGRQRLPGDD